MISIAVYDVGLYEYQRERISKWCSVQVRSMGSATPPNMRSNRAYLPIALYLEWKRNAADILLWIDNGIIYTKQGAPSFQMLSSEPEWFGYGTMGTLKTRASRGKIHHITN